MHTTSYSLYYDWAKNTIVCKIVLHANQVRSYFFSQKRLS